MTVFFSVAKIAKIIHLKRLQSAPFFLKKLKDIKKQKKGGQIADVLNESKLQR